MTPDTRRSLVLLLAGSLLLALSVSLVVRISRTTLTAREESIPLAGSLPALEKRTGILRAQVEASELHAAAEAGSRVEELHLYVLPDDTKMQRLLSLFDVVQGSLTHRGLLRGSFSVDAGASATQSDIADVQALPVHVHATLRPEGLRELLALISASGLLTVADALTPADFHLLLERTVGENPTALPALQQFLAIDLLSYARDPSSYEERLLHAFSDDAFSALLRSAMDTPALQEARRALGGDLGQAIAKENLAPLPFITLEEADRRELPDGWLSVDLKIDAYARH